MLPLRRSIGAPPAYTSDSDASAAINICHIAPRYLRLHRYAIGQLRACVLARKEPAVVKREQLPIMFEYSNRQKAGGVDTTVCQTICQIRNRATVLESTTRAVLGKTNSIRIDCSPKVGRFSVRVDGEAGAAAIVYEYRGGAWDHIVRVAFPRPARSVTYVVMALAWPFSGPNTYRFDPHRC